MFPFCTLLKKKKDPHLFVPEEQREHLSQKVKSVCQAHTNMSTGINDAA